MTKMKKQKLVALTAKTNEQLDEIVKKRQKGAFYVVTKIGVVGELIDKAHKKEVK